MVFVYVAIGFVVLVIGIAFAAYRYGYSKKTESDLSTELKNAKIAKDVRSGEPLDDKWLRQRD